jgi:CheY-like chemotaxis protein
MQTKVDAKLNTNVILCVDDEVIGLDVRRALLESRGYRVLTAQNGSDALVLFSSEAMDLVVLDYRMPEMNGDIVASRMKELRPDLPIIMLSAYVDLPSETLALVDRVVMKGGPPTVLLDTITALLGDGLSVCPRVISAE